MWSPLCLKKRYGTAKHVSGTEVAVHDEQYVQSPASPLFLVRTLGLRFCPLKEMFDDFM